MLVLSLNVIITWRISHKGLPFVMKLIINFDIGNPGSCINKLCKLLTFFKFRWRWRGRSDNSEKWWRIKSNDNMGKFLPLLCLLYTSICTSMCTLSLKRIINYSDLHSGCNLAEELWNFQSIWNRPLKVRKSTQKIKKLILDTKSHG